MKHTPGLNHTIAEQSAKLQLRRQHIRQRKTALRGNALAFCGRPSTLLAAFVAGSVLATVFPYPTQHTDRPKRVQRPGAMRAFLRRYLSSSVQLVLVNAIRRMFAPAPHHSDVEYAGEHHVSPGEAL